MWLNLTDDQITNLRRVLVGCKTEANAERALVDVDRTIARFIRGPEEDAYFAAACDQHSSDGDLEFDDDAVVSMGEDPGAYVMGWKWVTCEEAGLPRSEED